MRFAVLGAATVMALSSCDQVAQVAGNVTGGLAGLSTPRDATGEGIRTLSLLGGDVRVRGPEGYCIDQRASNARRGFAVLAGCALLADDADIMPNLDGLITVQFGAPDTASVTDNEEAFAAFLKSDAGRQILAANGDLAAVGDVNTITDRSAVLARFEDTAGTVFPNTAGPQWRGFVDVQGRLVTVSVLSFERNTLSRGEGERLLVVALAELIEANAPQAVAQ